MGVEPYFLPLGIDLSGTDVTFVGMNKWCRLQLSKRSFYKGANSNIRGKCAKCGLNGNKKDEEEKKKNRPSNAA